ncbi:MAG: DUF4105 domain-containing protein [Muribaculaceae bacterium]|nr:DUF4105 domain-containing protein [Muribaculaceae bacterium]
MKSKIFTLLLLVLSTVARAELKVELLTIEPGPEVHQLEGHTELRLYDPARGIDETVSWGVFDFDSPGFLYRFVKGETDYMAVAYDYPAFLISNAMSGRRVLSQPLNLTADEAEYLYALVSENVKPENRVYRYNYVKDNCATRPLEMIETAIGSKLTIPGDTAVSTTWRREMARYHRNYPWYQFGIDLALGNGIDKPLTLRETCYSPVALNRYVDRALRPDGTPLVAGAEKVVVSGTPDGEPQPATHWFLTPMAVGFYLLIFTVVIISRQKMYRQLNRIWICLLYSLAGVCGLVLTYLIFVSTHEATSPNWLYLWLNPLAFIAAIGIWLKKYNRSVYLYQIVNFVALLVLIVVGMTGIQHLNTAFYPFIATYMLTSAAYIYKYRCQTK